MTMKIQKPNWTPLELHEKLNRLDDLTSQTMEHESDCRCNACMEFFALDKLIEKFSKDEITLAVIEANKKYGK